jgi:hypothetical protein
VVNHPLDEYLDRKALSPALPDAAAARLAGEVLNALLGMDVYPRSIVAAGHALVCLGKHGGAKMIGIVSKDPGRFNIGGRTTTAIVGERTVRLASGPASSENAAVLRRHIPWLAARPLGLAKSAGCGDRLGLATPGHVRAIRKTRLAPIFAQQSVRENERTGRTPRQVMDDAVWGVFQEGWRDGFGADADHLKIPADIDPFVSAGYTFYTIDPGDHVDNAAAGAPAAELNRKLQALPWKRLESSAADLKRSLTRRPIDLGGDRLQLSEEDVVRAAVKYGKVVAHSLEMYRRLAAALGGHPFDFEISVDETETITTVAEHVYIASELKRLGLSWVSLAPRYVGEFEKGVDYIGDLNAFEASFAQHAAVAKTFGPYKLSLHSGSDKFSIYPIASRVAGGLLHLKTAGTSYLEALRTVAVHAPALFRRIAVFAVERYPTDRASYHVSARTDRMADVAALADTRLPELLDEFHAREILHVTYGSVLNQSGLRDDFFACLHDHEADYTAFVERHFDRHFAALAA